MPDASVRTTAALARSFARVVHVGRLGLAAGCIALAQAHTPPEPLPTAVSAILARRFPALHVLSHASGALHAAGAHDVAVVLGLGEHGVRIVSVVWSEPGGGVRFADASGDVAAACPGCDVDVRVVTRENPHDDPRDAAPGRLLEVTTSDPGGATASVHTWRFAYRGTRGDVLRLVGLRNEQISRGEGEGGVVDTIASTDLLTGAKVDVIDGEHDGVHRRLQADSRVALRQPILFSQCAFDVTGRGRRDAARVRARFPAALNAGRGLFGRDQHAAPAGRATLPPAFTLE